MKYRKGMTIIELIVAMAILSILLAIGVAFFRTQLSTGSKQQKIASIQSDIQTALTLIKWDLMMAGYGVPASILPISGLNNNDDGRDRITIRGTQLAIGGVNKWSFTVDISTGNKIHIRKWGKNDIDVGDFIIVMSDKKEPVGPPAVVTAREEETDPYGLPAYALTINQNISTAQGNFVFAIPPGTFLTATYYYNDGKLFRNNDVFLNNVEDFQVAYWVDLNDDGFEDEGEWFNDIATLSSTQIIEGLKKIRLTIVEATPPDPNYTYPETEITVEDHIYSLSDQDIHKRRRFYTIIAKMRNLR